MPIVPDAQLIAFVLFGPCAPNSIATLQLAAPAKTFVANVVDTDLIPSFLNTMNCSSANPTPPSALPIIEPTRSWSSRVMSSSASPLLSHSTPRVMRLLLPLLHQPPYVRRRVRARQGYATRFRARKAVR